MVTGLKNRGQNKATPQHLLAFCKFQWDVRPNKGSEMVSGGKDTVWIPHQAVKRDEDTLLKPDPFASGGKVSPKSQRGTREMIKYECRRLPRPGDIPKTKGEDLATSVSAQEDTMAFSHPA